MLDEQSWALLRRLTRWLDPFKDCFGHRAQVASLTQYVHGLLGDSARKSMQAMLARVTEPRAHEAFQHFITHAPWDVGPVWRRLLAVLPERRGVLILDDTGFSKQARTRSGCRGNTPARWQDWELPSRRDGGAVDRCTRVAGGAELYLPQGWVTPSDVTKLGSQASAFKKSGAWRSR